MTIALAFLACIFAALWWRARRNARAWKDAALGWEEVSSGWQRLFKGEQEARQRWQDYTFFWQSIALKPLEPATLTGRVQ